MKITKLNRMRRFEKGVLRGIFGFKREKAVGR
jgi:hypothetical protein